MADKNKNGIDDSVEGYRSAKKSNANANRFDPAKTSITGLTSGNGGQVYKPSQDNTARPGIMGFLGNIGNAATDVNRRLFNFQDTVNRFFQSRPQAPVGGGLGDSMYGAERSYSWGKPSTPNTQGFLQGTLNGVQNVGDQQAQARKTLVDYLQEMLGSGMFGSSGGGGYTPVDYSSQRNTLQSNYANNDAKLEAMYRQLSNSIAADAKPLDAAYQGAIDTTRQNGVDAQAQTNAAYNALAAHQAQVAQNLGIQQAQQNSAINGTDVNPQLASSLTKQASNQQSALDQLASARSAAAANNVNVGTAARQEGTMARSMAQQKLAALLSQIDMQQQNQNAQLQASARSAGSNGLSEALQYAQAMFNADQTQQKQDDLNAYNAQQLALKAQKASPQSQVSIDTILKGLTQRGIQIPSNARDLASLIQATKGLGF